MKNNNKKFISRLKLSEYCHQIQLNKKYQYENSGLILEERKEIVNYLLNVLITEDKSLFSKRIPNDYEIKRKLLRALLNIREPKPLESTFLQPLNCLLQSEVYEKGIVEVDKLNSVSEFMSSSSFKNCHKFILWQGDITRLKVDAIVNAANRQMLGCFQPLHNCIDNVIHSAAGPQLREDCQTIMNIQGEFEKTGDAKITRAYNLPSNYVLHTVGPIVPKGTSVSDKQKTELAYCYNSCLDLANEIENIKSVAFCCISTGVFGFPKGKAAEIAVRTVNSWLNEKNNRFDKIIFNVFSEDDYNEYIRIFQNQ
ncbi:protein-ADP-ribose hydrolase [Clostridium ganghwense]|uniref:Protein-ADP-ribose hydrolase n=1 Tax=Clostridium ganghwense TaxID=312089 RepID=A0ABT4CJN5_9CLOT|nr:protein-ADP-ribose hydrolase [Clostridium ganghwense]MCY6369262.1 protein-ADP-ribose hydrolase [Clostridium ganghwense]